MSTMAIGIPIQKYYRFAISYGRPLVSSISYTICFYFFLNLVVTIQNKTLVDQTRSPNILTTIHAMATYITTEMVRGQSQIQDLKKPVSQARLPRTQQILLLGFSALYMINIAVSNLSLHSVSLSLHQTIRVTAPVLTALISTICFRDRAYPLATYLALIPIVCGVAIATYGEKYTATPAGFIVTFLGAVLAVIKTILTQRLQTQYNFKMEAVELLHHLSFHAIWQAILLVLYNNEYNLIRNTSWTKDIVIVGVTNLMAAALLNIVSFRACRDSGPVSMAVTANLKQIAILVLAVIRTDTRPGFGLVVGTVMTAVGGVCYAISRSSSAVDTGSVLPVKETRGLR